MNVTIDTDTPGLTTYTDPSGRLMGYVGPRPTPAGRTFHSEPHGVAAALRAEAPHRTLEDRYDLCDCCYVVGEERMSGCPVAKRWIRMPNKRAARKVRMARKRRRGWA